MSPETSELNGVMVVSLEGKLMGLPEETSLTDLIYEFVGQDKTKVVLDLSRVTWMNSRALGMCIAGMTTLRNRGGDLRLASLSKQVDSLLTKCHLNTCFRCFNTIEEAVESF